MNIRKPRRQLSEYIIFKKYLTLTFSKISPVDFENDSSHLQIIIIIIIIII